MSDRKRISRDKVRENAKQGGRGPSWFNLPEGVSTFTFDKEGKYSIDVLPYETTDKNHPDNIEPGTIWYKREIIIHFDLGPDGRASAVCPTCVGKKCPIHEAAAKLEREYGKNPDKDQQETLRTLRGKKQIIMNIKDPEDRTKVLLFHIASGKFWSFKGGGLQKELDSGNEEILTFFDVKDGKTMTIRMSEESFGGRKFIQASRFDFEDRKDMDEDKILAKTVNLDECLNVLSYDKLKDLYDMGSGDDDEEKPSTSSKKRPKDEDDEDEDAPKSKKKPVEDSDDEEEEAPKKPKKKVVDEDEDEDEDAPKKKPKKPVEDSDDEEETVPTCKEEDCDRPCAPGSKRCKKHTPKPDDDDDE